MFEEESADPRAELLVCQSWPHLPKDVFGKAFAGLVQQLRSHREVELGAGDVNVAQIGRQQRQQSLDILTFSVPRSQPMDRRGVPQIMEARLIPGAIFATDAGPVREPPEGALDEARGIRAPSLRNKKWGITALRVPMPFFSALHTPSSRHSVRFPSGTSRVL